VVGSGQWAVIWVMLYVMSKYQPFPLMQVAIDVATYKRARKFQIGKCTLLLQVSKF
jgi:hypothetical protein